MTSEGTTVRPAALEDIDLVLPLAADFVSSFELDAAKFRATYEHLLENQAAVVLLAESEGDLAGYCLGFVHDTFYANGPVAWLEEIMVASKKRRSGIGEQLVRSFEVWARQQGAAVSALATRRAEEFYTAIGYEDSATYFRRLL